MHTSTDTFTAVELYLLAAAFGGNVLFGLPEKEVFQLKGEEVFEEAHKHLIEKGILTSDGKITDGGAFVIRAIEYYHQSEKYVRINNLMFAFREQDVDELIVLLELEEKETYQLFIVSKALVLSMLGEKFPVVLREPDEKEKKIFERNIIEPGKKRSRKLRTGKYVYESRVFSVGRGTERNFQSGLLSAVVYLHKGR